MKYIVLQCITWWQKHIRLLGFSWKKRKLNIYVKFWTFRTEDILKDWPITSYHCCKNKDEIWMVTVQTHLLTFHFWFTSWIILFFFLTSIVYMKYAYTLKSAIHNVCYRKGIWSITWLFKTEKKSLTSACNQTVYL